jgi:hypothetical protein
MQVHLAGMAAVCMCLQLSHDLPSWQGVHAELASEHLASVAATSALQLLAPAAAAPLGQDPAEYLAACGFFAVLAACLRRQRLTAWHMWAHLSHQAVGHAIAAAAGRLDVWPDSSTQQPSDALVSGLAACAVAHMSRCRLPLPPHFFEHVKAAQLARAGRAVWTDCSILGDMLRSRRRRRHALVAGAVPAMVAALRWSLQSKLPSAEAGAGFEAVQTHASLDSDSRCTSHDNSFLQIRHRGVNSLRFSGAHLHHSCVTADFPVPVMQLGRWPTRWRLSVRWRQAAMTPSACLRAVRLTGRRSPMSWGCSCHGSLRGWSSGWRRCQQR